MTANSRRHFLRLLASSPLLASLDLPSLFAQGAASAQADVIASVSEALNVLDFEAAGAREAAGVALGLDGERRRGRRNDSRES
jgi:hypothetical protein